MRSDRWLVVFIVLVLAVATTIFVVKGERLGETVEKTIQAPSGSLSVLVVGLEGLDLSIVEELVAEGRLPNLERLMSEGSTASFNTLGKLVDKKIAWTSLVTGVSPENQGIGGTMVSPTKGVPVQAPLIPESRTVGTLWTALSDAGTRVGVLGWWGTWPVEEIDGVMMAPYETYYLEKTHSRTMTERLIYPPELDDSAWAVVHSPESYRRADLSMFVNTEEGLGLEALIGMGYDDLARAYAADTSMHGLAIEMASELNLEAELVLLPGACIVGETFWHMAHPEDMRWEDLPEASAEQFERQIPALRDVMRRYYVMLDGLLGDLLQLAGADATVAVVSDHGMEGWVYGRDGNPLLGPNMYDETGFWVMSGPRVREGVKLHDLELIDFAPTLAAAAGIEMGHEPEGRVCRDALID